MASTATPQNPATIKEPGPLAVDAFVADRQAFWGSFTTFVTFSAGAIVLPAGADGDLPGLAAR